MRIWDLFLFDGSKILFQVAIGLLKMYETELLGATNAAEIFNTLSTIPSQVQYSICLWLDKCLKPDGRFFARKK